MNKYQNIRRATSPNLNIIVRSQDEVSNPVKESQTTGSQKSLSFDNENEERSRKNSIETNPETFVIDEIKSKIIDILCYKEKINILFNQQVDGLQSELSSMEKQNAIMKTVMNEMKNQVKQMKTDISMIKRHLQFNDNDVQDPQNFQKNKKSKERKVSKPKQSKLFNFSSIKTK